MKYIVWGSIKENRGQIGGEYAINKKVALKKQARLKKKYPKSRFHIRKNI